MYFMSSIDNNSKKVWVYFMKKAEVESQFGRSSALNLRMLLSSRMVSFWSFMKSMVLRGTLQHEEHLYRVGWLRELIEQLVR